MNYATVLDNSWDILSEEDMYEINGGFWCDNGVSRYWTAVASDVSIIAFVIGKISIISSIGQLIARGLDFADGSYNGRVRSSNGS